MLKSFILLLPCFVCLFWAIIFFLQRKTNNRVQNMCIGVSLVMAVSTYIWSIPFSGVDNYSLFYKLELIEAFATLLLLPLLYFCFRTLTDEKKLGWKDYLWFLPALLIGSSMLTLYLLMNDEQATNYVIEINRNQGKLVTITDPLSRGLNLINMHIYTPVIIAQIVYILIYATRRLIRYRKRLNDYFSNKDGKSLENSTTLLVLVFVILLLSLIAYRGRFYYNETSTFIACIMLCWGIVIYVFGYNVFRMRYTVENLAQEMAADDKEALAGGYGIYEGKSGEDDENDYLKNKNPKLLPLFNRLINEDKIFLQPDLRVADLARKLHTNRTYISRLIKEEYQSNFSDFINSKRIEYAQKLIQTQPDLTQEQIAQQSGFVYTTTFSRIFKQHAGVTFREFYRRTVQ